MEENKKEFVTGSEISPEEAEKAKDYRITVHKGDFIIHKPGEKVPSVKERLEMFKEKMRRLEEEENKQEKI